MQDHEVEAFKAQVLSAVDDLEVDLATHEARYARPPSDEPIDPEFEARKQALREAESALKKKNVLSRICPGLRGVANDARDIAKWSTPVLLPLAMAGTISLNPLVFAAIALVIVRLGINSICSEAPGESQKPQDFVVLSLDKLHDP